MRRLDYIAHHGVKGQKWGVRNGPPYPIDRQKTINDMSILQHLSKTVDSFEYGTIIDGKRYGENDLAEVDWSKYKTLPIQTIKKEKIGNCWDMVNYQHYVLDKAGIPNKNYMFVMQRSNEADDVVTHTFTIAEIDGSHKWIESAMWKKRGIHDVTGPKDVSSQLAAVYGKGNYDLFEFNPDGMDKGLTDQEYFNRATAGDPIYQRKQ